MIHTRRSSQRGNSHIEFFTLGLFQHTIQWQQLPAEKVVEKASYRETCSANFHCLQHPWVPELVEHHIWIKEVRRLNNDPESNQISEAVTGCISLSLQKANPEYLGMPGKKEEVWVKGKASPQHCIVQNKGQMGTGLILEEKTETVCRLHSQSDYGRKAKI